jgi:ribonuclease HII
LLKQFYDINNAFECGLDEAGRGCLCGSVFAAAVILNKDFQNEVLNDSKQLSDKRRRELRKVIEENAVSYAVAEVTAEEIDKINILNASILAMNRADPQYHWDKNKGYPTKDHREALKQYGVTPLHRKTYNLFGELSLFD